MKRKDENFAMHDDELDIDLADEYTLLDDDWYSGVIDDIFFYGDKTSGRSKVTLKIRLSESDIFVAFLSKERLAQYPFAQLYRYVDSKKLTSIIGLEIDFEIKNNTTRDGTTFSNIKSIEIVEEESE